MINLTSFLTESMIYEGRGNLTFKDGLVKIAKQGGLIKVQINNHRIPDTGEGHTFSICNIGDKTFEIWLLLNNDFVLRKLKFKNDPATMDPDELLKTVYSFFEYNIRLSPYNWDEEGEENPDESPTRYYEPKKNND